MGIPFTSSETYRADDLNSLMEMVMAEDNNVCYTPLSNLKELKLSSDGKLLHWDFITLKQTNRIDIMKITRIKLVFVFPAESRIAFL